MGRAAALRLAAEGARLALLGRRAEPLRDPRPTSRCGAARPWRSPATSRKMARLPML
nr:hypothetical protein [Methylobacterium terricola]